MTDAVLDTEVRDALVNGFSKRGIKIHEASLAAVTIEKKGDKFVVTRKQADGKEFVQEEYDQIFNCWSRVSKVDSLALQHYPEIKVTPGSTNLIAGGNFGVHELTNNERIFAVGDVLVGTARNNPAAEFGGKRVAKMIKDLIDLQKESSGKKSPEETLKAKQAVYSKYRNFTNQLMPLTVFSTPSASMVGMTEAEAVRAYGRDDIKSVTLKRFALIDDFAQTKNSDLHMYKLVYRKSDDKILGIHFVGDQGEEILYGLGIAMRSGLTRAALHDGFFIHPSRSEVFWKTSDAEESATLESC